MNFKEFLELLVKEMQKEMGENYAVSTDEVIKNNGLVLNGLIIKEKDARIAPTIYIEGFYEEYMNGIRIESIIHSIRGIYVNGMKDVPQLSSCNFESFEDWKGKIFYKLISQKENTDLLKKIPFTPFLDLAIVYYGLVTYTEEGYSTFLIHDNHMELFGIGLDILHKQAKENTEKLLPEKIEDLNNTFASMTSPFNSIPVNPNEMFCLSNNRSIFGAIAILYDKVLEKFADKLCSDIIIIPSSIHETLLIRYKEDDVYELNDMVKRVNANILEEDEVLSDHAYLYTRADGKIHMLQEKSEL